MKIKNIELLKKNRVIGFMEHKLKYELNEINDVLSDPSYDYETLKNDVISTCEWVIQEIKKIDGDDENDEN